MKSTQHPAEHIAPVAPATPLPWLVEMVEPSTERWIAAVISPQDGGDLICNPPDKDCEESIARWPQNANYIVKACNAYPKLIKALQDIYRDEKLDDGDERLTQSRIQASQLLHALGEPFATGSSQDKPFG